MVNSPLVTVNILSFNRKDELRNTLTKVYEQDYKNIEVIVVDNASSDCSPEMVGKEFPNTNLIKLQKNIGIAGWNEGFKAAKGEYVLVLDDDSYPTQDVISKAIIEFKNDKYIGVIAFKIWNSKKRLYEISNYNVNTIPHFVGCGAMIKKEIFNTVGFFNEKLFLYEHERDFTLRLYDKNFSIKYLDGLLINHNSSQLNRTDKRKKYFFTRNYLIVLFTYFSLPKVFFRIIRVIAGRLFSGIKQGGFLSIFKGIVSFLILIPNLIIYRKPVKKSVQQIFGYGSFAGGFHFKEYDWFN